MGNLLNLSEERYGNIEGRKKWRNGVKMGNIYKKITSLHIPKIVIKIMDFYFHKDYFVVILLSAPLTSLFLRL